MIHRVTVGPSAAKIVDTLGRVSPLPKPRSNTYRARCTCGWRSAEQATEEQAKIDGDAHVRAAARVPVSAPHSREEKKHDG